MNAVGKRARRRAGNRYDAKRKRRQGNPNSLRYKRRQSRHWKVREVEVDVYS